MLVKTDDSDVEFSDFSDDDRPAHVAPAASMVQATPPSTKKEKKAKRETEKHEPKASKEEEEETETFSQSQPPSHSNVLSAAMIPATIPSSDEEDGGNPLVARFADDDDEEEEPDVDAEDMGVGQSGLGDVSIALDIDAAPYELMTCCSDTGKFSCTHACLGARRSLEDDFYAELDQASRFLFCSFMYLKSDVAQQRGYSKEEKEEEEDQGRRG